MTTTPAAGETRLQQIRETYAAEFGVTWEEAQACPNTVYMINQGASYQYDWELWETTPDGLAWLAHGGWEGRNIEAWEAFRTGLPYHDTPDDDDHWRVCPPIHYAHRNADGLWVDGLGVPMWFSEHLENVIWPPLGVPWVEEMSLEQAQRWADLVGIDMWTDPGAS